MKKRIFAFLLMVSMIFTTTAPILAADTITARATSSTVLVNGKNAAFDAYNINGSNYFKLRDLALMLSHTEKQFEVGWDGANNAITLTSGKWYTTVGGEMTGKGTGNKTAVPTNSKIILDGKETQFTAYNIEGNNYFKLRDIGAAFDFGVDWDVANDTIVIDTKKGNISEQSQPPIDNSKTEAIELTEESVYNAMMALQAEYPEGMKWTTENVYTSNDGSWNTGCMAFAMILSDAAFGNLPYRWHADYDNIKTGDILAYNNHAVIVLNVEGDNITIAEGNSGSVIHWEIVLSLARMKARDAGVFTRWPEA